MTTTTSTAARPNRYMIEREDGGYRRASREDVNRAVVAERAHWVGTDVDDDGTVVHYADRGTGE